MLRPVTSLEEASLLVAGHPDWHHAFEIFPGLSTPGTYQPAEMLASLQLGPMAGKRVLDVGASNGYFSRELDRLGADVVAFDYRTKEMSGFAVMEACYGRPIRHVHGNVARIAEMELGRFDVILCLGVIYHLPDPVRALFDLRAMCRERLFVETYVEDFDDRPAARYYPGAELNRDQSNFWAFNPSGVEAMMADVGLEVRRAARNGDRLLVETAPTAQVPRKMQRAYGLLPLSKAR